LSWQAGQELLEAALSWSGFLSSSSSLDSADLAFRLSSETLAGAIDVKYLQSGQEGALEANLEFKPAVQGFAIPRAGLSFAGMSVNGSGCLLTQDEPSLHMMMSSSSVDLDKLSSLMPGEAGNLTEAGEVDFPLALNVRLSVQEILAAGATVRDAEISVGQQPDCSLLPD
jgi:hypothetical protein